MFLIVWKPWVVLSLWSLWDTWAFAKASFSFESAVNCSSKPETSGGCAANTARCLSSRCFLFGFSGPCQFSLPSANCTLHRLKKTKDCNNCHCSLNLQYKSSSSSQSWHLKHKHQTQTCFSPTLWSVSSDGLASRSWLWSVSGPKYPYWGSPMIKLSISSENHSGNCRAFIQISLLLPLIFFTMWKGNKTFGCCVICASVFVCAISPWCYCASKQGGWDWSYSISLICFVCLTLMSDVRKGKCNKESGVVWGGYLGWHEQLLTEKRDPLVAMATLVLPTLACISVYSLFVQSQSRWTKTGSVEWKNAAIE